MVNRRVNRLINAIIACCLVGFVVIFLKAPANEPQIQMGVPAVDKDNGWSPEEWKQLNKEIANDTNFIQHADLSGWSFVQGNATISGEEIVHSMQFLNENFDVLNTDKFGPPSNVKTILVVQVHNRPAYLQILIESMRKTKGIDETLIVFSHDINVSVINQMIRNITFARVYQIFYPYNLQLFPSVYPGQNVKDCPEKFSKSEAEMLQCRNWKTPDKYGNYRVAKLTQIKHHWWWKMNFVFDGIVDRFQMDDPWILLLEEDHILVPDALHVLNTIIDNKSSFCENCAIISLGYYLKSMNGYGDDINKLAVQPWYSSRHNMGMAIQRQTWNVIRDCSTSFCNWDDYNWDWSLMQVSAKCVSQRFRVIFAKSPRVLHIGDCGVHTHRCAAHKALDAAMETILKHKNALFPSSLVVSVVSRKSLKPSKENGGWGDARDRELCQLNKYPLVRHTSSEETVLKELLNSKILLNSTPQNNTLRQSSGSL
ncbi:unnamed protein product [Caenorhabditis bovis]|uniref:Alpha-1,6-mannosyl-glycoprotein 2-beta-N-acetylglucosaminyltransferase n=1 Tax=Caenorhabditis bovis TaxID=2654633 RepID=A0A8S1EB57_9PELO|nr:unnamed protein product [Caenorhabditis bovis]